MKRLFGEIATLVTGLLFILLLTSCRPEPVDSGEAQIIVLAPAAEEVTNSDIVDVNVFVDNFKLVDQDSQLNRPGEGRIIYYLDVNPPLVKGQTATSADGTYAISSLKTYEWKNLSPGPHNFWVQLVNNDNTPLEPPAAVRVPVTVVLK